MLRLFGLDLFLEFGLPLLGRAAGGFLLFLDLAVLVAVLHRALGLLARHVAQVGDECNGHTAVVGDLRAAHALPLKVFQQGHHCLAFVCIAAAHAVLGIDRCGMEDGVAECAVDHLRLDAGLACPLVRVVAVVAIGQVVVDAVEERKDWRELVARFNSLRIFGHCGLVNLDARLQLLVKDENAQVECFDHAFCPLIVQPSRNQRQ